MRTPVPRQAIRDAVREAFAPVMEDVLRPMLDAVHALHDAVDEIEDDAELGRRARVIIREHASAIIERQLAQRSEAAS